MKYKRILSFFVCMILAFSSVVSAAPSASYAAVADKNISRDAAQNEVYGQMLSLNLEEAEDSVMVFTAEDKADLQSTGKYKYCLSGLAASAYAALEKTPPTPTSNEVTFTYTYQKGETRESVDEIAYDALITALRAFRNDHMEEYLWASNAVGYQTHYNNSSSVTYILRYPTEEYYTNAIGQKAKAKIDQALASMKADNRYEQVKYIYDWLCDNGSYDYEALKTDISDEYSFFAHSALGILTRGKGVCESYAKSFQIFCDRLGIPCLYITGSGHAWNYVQMENKNWYMVDATWGDQDSWIDYNYLLSSNYPNIEGHVPDHTFPYLNTYIDKYTSSAEHHFGEPEIKTEVSCTQNGSVVYTCEDCGYKKTITLPALGHNYELTSKSGNTETGFTYIYTCDQCGDSYSETFQSCTSHEWNVQSKDWSTDSKTYTVTYQCSVCGEKLEFTEPATEEIITAQSCTQSGQVIYRATVVATLQKITTNPNGTTQTTQTTQTFNAQKTVFYPATGHNYLLLRETSDGGSCSAGTKKVYECSICKATKEENVPGKEHTWDNGVINKAPDCVNKGEKLFTCSVCHSTKTETIAALGHKYSAKVIAPTCAEGGYTLHTCSQCGNSYKDNYTAATNKHSYNAGVITLEPTESSAGQRLYTCTVCKATKTEEIAPLSHTSHNLYAKEKVEPTCTTDGYTLYQCTDCSYTEKSEIKKKTGHLSIVNRIEPANMYADGFYIRYCEDCDTTLSDETIYSIAKVVLPTTVFTYRGNPITPDVEVYDRRGRRISDNYYEVIPQSNTAVGTAKVIIMFDGLYDDITWEYFKINPKPVTIKSLKAASKAFTVKWSKQTAQCQGYEIQYSTSSSFAAGSATKTVKIKKNTTVSKKISKLKAKKKYYVRIRTYKTVNGVTYTSSWSSKKSIKTK